MRFGLRLALRQPWRRTGSFAFNSCDQIHAYSFTNWREARFVGPVYYIRRTMRRDWMLIRYCRYIDNWHLLISGTERIS